ncbi:MAG: diphthine synthase [Methanobacteriaceae archaeon]
MLYFIGLGLFDEKDISIKGLESIKNSDIVYAEFFTSRLFGSSFEELEALCECKIIVLNREEVEEEQKFLNDIETKDVAFLCAGDPLIATTHSDFLVEAKKKGIKTQVIHSSSILSAAPGISGLQAYKFGKVTTIPFPDENFFPHSPYLAIKNNLENDAHTLVLLDIQAHKDRYMTVNQGFDYLLKIGLDINDTTINKETLAIGIAHAGAKNPIIKAGSIKKLINEDFGNPLHCIIIPSKLHIVEAEYLVAIAGANNSILEDI